MRHFSMFGVAVGILGLSAATASAAPTSSAVTGMSSPADAIAQAPDGAMWLSEPTGPGRIAKVDKSRAVTEYTGGVTSGFPAAAAPSSLSVPSDGNPAFTVSTGGGVFGRLNASTGAVSILQDYVQNPTSTASGPDGGLWMTGDSLYPYAPDQIIRYASAGYTTGYFGAMSSSAQPSHLVAGGDGAYWFTLTAAAGKVGRIGTDGTVSYPSLTPGDTGASPSALGPGLGGTTWFARGTQLGPVGADAGTLLATAVAPTTIALGPDGAVWAGGSGGFTRVATDGTAATVSAGISSSAKVVAATPGQDGRLWAALDRSPYLVRVTVPPRVDALTAVATDDTTATLSAPVNPNGLATTVNVDVKSGSSWTPAGSTSLGNDVTATTTRFDLSNLATAAGTLVRITATNSAGMTTQSAALPTPTPKPTPTPSPTPTVVPTPVATPTPVPTPELTPTPVPSLTPLPTPTPLPTDLPTPAPTPTPLPVLTPTPLPTRVTELTPLPTLAPVTPEPEPTPEADRLTPTPLPSVDLADPTPAATPAPTPTPSDGPVAVPVPVQGASLVLRPERGTVTFRVPGSVTPRTVASTATIPTGSIIDTTRGAVTLSSRIGGATQDGRFSGGEFRVRQVPTTGLTQLYLTAPLDCSDEESATEAEAKPGKRGQRATRAAAKKAGAKRRHVWGQDSGGQFQTHGRDSVATVRGTKWLTTDTCTATVVKVFEGAVSVQPKAGGKATLLKAGGRLSTPHQG